MKKATYIFIILSVFASGLNYITYPALGRILPGDQYVNITVSLSLLTQMSTFLSSIVAITIGLSKRGQQTGGNHTIEVLQATLFKLFLIVIGVFLVLSPMIMSHIRTPLIYVLPICLMMLVSIPISVISGYLNGRNLLIKLGMLTAVSALIQFVATISLGLVTHNGLVALISMGLGQLATIPIVYWLFSNDNLPRLSGIFSSNTKSSVTSEMKRLVTYTFFASLAIMLINLVQIADLVLIKSLGHADVKFYTDIYVISRIVFFGGMIFIWPFLAEITLDQHHLNIRPLAKLIAIFALLTIAAISALYLWGPLITHILFGTNYDGSEIRSFALLSIMYKFFFLLITAVVLYFIVHRSYAAVAISSLIGGAILVYSAVISSTTSSHAALYVLNIIAAGGAALCLITFYYQKRKQIN